MKNPKYFVEKELKDLGVPLNSTAAKLLLEQSIEVQEMMTRAELKKHIQEYLDSLPNELFHEY